MFLTHLHRSPRFGRSARAASYVAAAAAGAVALALWRRIAEIGQAIRQTAVPALPHGVRASSTQASLANAGWADILDDEGSVLGRARVMLAGTGYLSDDGQAPSGELRSLRLNGGATGLMPGRYRVRFEASRDIHAVVVTAPASRQTDVAPIRWDDPDLPAGLVERSAN